MTLSNFKKGKYWKRIRENGKATKKKRRTISNKKVDRYFKYQGESRDFNSLETRDKEWKQVDISRRRRRRRRRRNTYWER